IVHIVSNQNSVFIAFIDQHTNPARVKSIPISESKLLQVLLFHVSLTLIPHSDHFLPKLLYCMAAKFPTKLRFSLEVDCSIQVAEMDRPGLEIACSSRRHPIP
uniref:Uncharacterized protein n=1 Tax=Athene cunicularia TaxID=194338 RepID=A0A663LVV9_ATHCN